jgi:hypothetical protein
MAASAQVVGSPPLITGPEPSPKPPSKSKPLPDELPLVPPELDPDPEPPLDPPDPLLLLLNPFVWLLPQAATTTLQPRAQDQKKNEERSRIAKLSHCRGIAGSPDTAKDASRLIQVKAEVRQPRHWSGAGAMYARSRPPGYVQLGRSRTRSPITWQSTDCLHCGVGGGGAISVRLLPPG